MNSAQFLIYKVKLTIHTSVSALMLLLCILLFGLYLVNLKIHIKVGGWLVGWLISNVTTYSIFKLSGL